MNRKQSRNLSIIDRDLTVEGSITSQGRLVIKGTVRGAIEGEDVIIAEEGVVSSNIHVTNLTIGGVFQGEITALEELVILSTGNCSGKVVCRNLVVEGGGKLNAEVSPIIPEELKLVQNFSSPESTEFKETKRGHIVEI